MDIDQYLVWLSGAIKASFLDEGSIDEKLLTKNIKDCYTRVKSAFNNTSNKINQFDEFRLRSTLALLISTKCINSLEKIQCNREFQAVITTFPTIGVKDFFIVVRSQKNFKFLGECLSWVPVSVLCNIIQEFFKNTSDITPITLAISTELRKVLLFRLQHETSEYNKIEIEETMALFIKNTYSISGSTKDLIKIGGYYFIYLTDSALFLLRAILGKQIEAPLLCNITEVWKKVWFTDLKTAKPIPFLAKSLFSVLENTQCRLDAVTVNVWTEWVEHDLPLTYPSHRISQYQNKSRTLQSAICYNAFDFLRIWDTDLSLIQSTLLGTSQEIESIEGIIGFFRGVASDPDHDPDIDLNQKELITQIGLRDDRQSKLLGIFLDHKDIFDNNECLPIVKDNMASVDEKARENLLLHFIAQAKENRPYKDGWFQVVLDLASGIPIDRLLVVISDYLSHGQDDLLKSPDFNAQMTAVFNQLAGEDTTAVNSGRHIWLCLQSGVLVVIQAVDLAVNLPGLVPVMIKTLSTIREICRAVTVQGISQLVHSLEACMKRGLVGREMKDFTALVTGLMKNDILDPREVFKILIIPYLTIAEGKLDKLSLSLGLLLTLTEIHIDVLTQPDVELVAVMITMVYILDGTNYLHGPSAQKILDLRMITRKILSAYTTAILKDRKKFQREISLLKQEVVTLDVHPNSIIPVLHIFDKEDKNQLHFDNITELLLFKLGSPDSSHPENKNVKKNSIGDLKYQSMEDLSDESNLHLLKNVSNEDLTCGLLQILPHSNDSEWIRSFSLMHKHLSPGDSPYPVLQFHANLLYLMCTQVDPGESEDDKIVVASISIQHIFKSFSVAATVYVENNTKNCSLNQKFQTTCEVFDWWCSTVIKYECNADLPALFLMRLTGNIEKWIQETKIILIDNEESKFGNGVPEQKDQNHKMHCYIFHEEFKQKVFQMISSLVKFIPQCNVSASVASKLNKLYQLNVD